MYSVSLTPVVLWLNKMPEGEIDADMLTLEQDLDKLQNVSTILI